MNQPLSPEREHEIRLYDPTFRFTNVRDGNFFADTEAAELARNILDLLNEIDRLRAERAEHRDQVLTEAAELIRQHRGDLDDDLPWFDTRDRDAAAELLLAARTAPQEQETGR